MTEGESARLGTPEDWEIVSQIRSNHLTSIEGQRGADLLSGYELLEFLTKEAFGAIVDSSISFVVVGTYDDVIFGYATVAVETLTSGESLGVISEFVVEAEIRGSGIGEAMMNLIVDELGNRGCIGVDCKALPGDRETKNFFESFGLKARLLTVHKRF